MTTAITEERRKLSDAVAEEVRAWMARRRISGRELATALHVSPAWVSYRLVGKQEIGLNDLQRIAEVLNVPILELLPASAKGGDYLGGKAPVATRPVDNRPKNVTPKGVPRSGRDGLDLRRPRRLRPNPGMVPTQRVA